MHKKRHYDLPSAVTISATFFIGMVSSQVHANEGIAEFYKEKTITIFVGQPPGGGYDTYARLLARHMGKYIPGNPRFIVKNMPGASGEQAAGYVANVAPKDGTAIVAGSASQPLGRIFIPKGQKNYDASKLNYLGSAAQDTYVCIARQDAPVKKAEDLFERELIIGAGSVGTGTLTYMPSMAKNLLGIKIKLVLGYKGSRQIFAAIENGELHGLCGMNLSSINSTYSHFLRNGLLHILVQESVEGDKLLNSANIPRMYEFAKTDKQRMIMRTIYAQGKFARPYFLAGGIPQGRVVAMREAFMAAWADKVLLSEAKKLKLPVDPISGEAIQAIVSEIDKQPAGFIDEVKASINLN